MLVRIPLLIFGLYSTGFLKFILGTNFQPLYPYVVRSSIHMSLILRFCMNFQPELEPCSQSLLFLFCSSERLHDYVIHSSWSCFCIFVLWMLVLMIFLLDALVEGPPLWVQVSKGFQQSLLWICLWFNFCQWTYHCRNATELVSAIFGAPLNQCRMLEGFNLNCALSQIAFTLV